MQNEKQHATLYHIYNNIINQSHMQKRSNYLVMTCVNSTNIFTLYRFFCLYDK